MPLLVEPHDKTNQVLELRQVDVPAVVSVRRVKTVLKQVAPHLDYHFEYKIYHLLVKLHRL